MKKNIGTSTGTVVNPGFRVTPELMNMRRTLRQRKTAFTKAVNLLKEINTFASEPDIAEFIAAIETKLNIIDKQLLVR